MNVKRINPLSLIVFLLGVALAIVGIVLAIVFGVQHSKDKSCDCPTAAPPTGTTPSNSLLTTALPNNCDAKLFSIKTGVKNLTWDETLSDTSSKNFTTAQEKYSNQIADSLSVSSSSSNSISILDANEDKIVVTITRFEKAKDDQNMVIAYASGAVAAVNDRIHNLPATLDTTFEKQLSNNPEEYQSPTVNYDSTTFCSNINQYVNSTDEPSPSTPPPTDCPTTVCPDVPCTTEHPVTATVCPDCPTTTCPSISTTVPSTTSPPVHPSTCAPCPSEPPVTVTVCPDCPTTSCPAISTTVCPHVPCSTAPPPEPSTCAPCTCPTNPPTSSSQSTLTSPTTTPSTSQSTTLSTSSPSSPSIPTTCAPFDCSVCYSSSLSTSSPSLPPSTSSPSTSSLSTASPTPTACPGLGKYQGDIAIAYEMSPWGQANGDWEMLQNFIVNELLGYQGNPYQIGSDVTRVLLAPYPSTSSYSTLPQGYSETKQSLGDVNTELSVVEFFFGGTPQFTTMKMADAFGFINGVPDHGSNYGVTILVGRNGDFVKEAQSTASQLKGTGYKLFTIAINSTADFSSLSSGDSFSFSLPSPRGNEADAAVRAIGNFLLANSPGCTSPTTREPSTSTTTIPSSSTTQSSSTSIQTTPSTVSSTQSTVTSPTSTSPTSTVTSPTSTVTSSTTTVSPAADTSSSSASPTTQSSSTSPTSSQSSPSTEATSSQPVTSTSQTMTTSIPLSSTTQNSETSTSTSNPVDTSTASPQSSSSGSTMTPGSTESTVTELTSTVTVPSTTTGEVSTGSSTDSGSSTVGTTGTTQTDATSQSSSTQTDATTQPSTTQTDATTQPPTTTNCPGELKYGGDIAIAFEQVMGGDTNGQWTMMNIFLLNQLLGYLGNPYDIGSSTRVLMAPYPKTTEYPFASQYDNGPKSLASVNATITSIDLLTSTIPGAQHPNIRDGLNFISSAPDHGNNYGAVVIVGISGEEIADAVASARNLIDGGYHVFTVALNSTADFSPLASPDSSLIVDSPTDYNAARLAATTIGNYLLSQSSVCLPFSTTRPPPTTTTPTTLPPSSPPTTTPYCPHRYLKQDMIFVWEMSNQTGSYATSTFTNSFLISLIEAAMADLGSAPSPNYWTPLSNVSVVAFPDPSEYLHSGDFGKINSAANLEGVMTSMGILGKFVDDPSKSDINSGLLYAQNEMTHSDKVTSIVIFANSDTGVADATGLANVLKNEGVRILTVNVLSKLSFSIASLASNPSFDHTLDTMQGEDPSTKPDQVIKDIISNLEQISSVCCNDVNVCA